MNSNAQRIIHTELVKAKASVARAARDRLDAYQHAVDMVEYVEQARREINDANYRKGFEKPVSDNAIAQWLNDAGHLTRTPGLWSRKTVRTALMDADIRAIEHAVLECRTRMTAQALSADFTADTVSELEAEYLAVIAEALALGHRLRGNRARSADELAVEAKRRAIEVAAVQRARKPISTMARERLWDGFAPFPRKVFEA